MSTLIGTALSNTYEAAFKVDGTEYMSIGTLPLAWTNLQNNIASVKNTSVFTIRRWLDVLLPPL